MHCKKKGVEMRETGGKGVGVGKGVEMRDGSRVKFDCVLGVADHGTVLK